MRGQITMFHIKKGYGFVACGAKQIFFHHKNFQRGFQPVVGRWVDFEMGPGLPGRQQMAVNVRYAESEIIEQRFQEIASLAGGEGQGGAQ